MRAANDAKKHAPIVLRRPIERELLESIRIAAVQQCSRASLRAYGSDWARFRSFCELHNMPFLPADEPAIALFLADLQRNGLKISSIRRAVASVRWGHRLGGHLLGSLPLVSQLLSGYARRMDTSQRQVRPFLADHVKQIATLWVDGTFQEQRDLAVILVGWSMAARRSEVAGLHVENIAFNENGSDFTITLQHRKNRQNEVTRISVPAQDGPACPVKSLRKWLSAAKIERGALFPRILPNGKLTEKAIAGETVAEIVRRAVVLLGLDPSVYAGHSLRSGFVTSAAQAGVTVDKIRLVSGHKSLEKLDNYIRHLPETSADAARGLLSLSPSLGRRHFMTRARKLAARGATPKAICEAFERVFELRLSEETIAEWVK